MQLEVTGDPKSRSYLLVDVSVLGGLRMQIGSSVWDDTLRCDAKIRSGLIDIKILIEEDRARFGFGSVNSQQQFGSR